MDDAIIEIACHCHSLGLVPQFPSVLLCFPSLVFLNVCLYTQYSTQYSIKYGLQFSTLVFVIYLAFCLVSSSLMTHLFLSRSSTSMFKQLLHQVKPNYCLTPCGRCSAYSLFGLISQVFFVPMFLLTSSLLVLRIITILPYLVTPAYSSPTLHTTHSLSISLHSTN